MDNEKTRTIKIPGLFTTLLTILFITLKLCNVISWSWVWVLAPLWIPFAITLLAIIASVIWMNH